ERVVLHAVHSVAIRVVDVPQIAVDRRIGRLALHDEAEGADPVGDVDRATAGHLPDGGRRWQHDVDDLRDEGVFGAAEGGLEGAGGRGEVGGKGNPRHVGVAEGVHGDAEAVVNVTPAKVGG